MISDQKGKTSVNVIQDTIGPNVKAPLIQLPSKTSKCIKSAPALKTLRVSLANIERSPANTEGPTLMGSGAISWWIWWEGHTAGRNASKDGRWKKDKVSKNKRSNLLEIGTGNREAGFVERLWVHQSVHEGVQLALKMCHFSIGFGEPNLKQIWNTHFESIFEIDLCFLCFSARTPVFFTDSKQRFGSETIIIPLTLDSCKLT